MNLFNFSTGFLFASIFWSAVGAGFMVYGRKQGEITPLIGGIALVAISFFLSPLNMSLVAVGIIAAVFWVRRMF